MFANGNDSVEQKKSDDARVPKISKINNPRFSKLLDSRICAFLPAALPPGV